MRFSRRDFLKHSAAVAAGFGGLRTLSAYQSDKNDLLTEGYGELQPDPDQILELPKGFRYRIISEAGQMMNDGLVVPGKPDGMAAFPGPKGTTILVRNHEINPAVTPTVGPFGKDNNKLTDGIRAKLYDPGERPNLGARVPCLGGTTTLVYDTQRQRTVQQFLSLSGTLRNCAGGLTPWGSWITCEETVERAGNCLLYTSPSPRDATLSRMPSSA